MSKRSNRMWGLVLTLALLGLNLVALNYLLSGWSSARIDLTEDRMFSISPATKRLLSSLDEDVTIFGYFSKRTHPKLAPLVPEIVDLLEEYRAVSGGRVQIDLVSPEDEPAMEEAANRFGVSSTPFQLASKYETGIVNAYFALVVRYANEYERYSFQDLIVIDPLPDGDIQVRLRNLEYDLTRAIKKVVHGASNTADLFGRISGPVKLMAIISPDTLPEIFAEVPDAIRTAAEELKQTGGDAFVFEEIDPSRDEARMSELGARFGIRPMSLGFFSDESFYLYGILDIGGRLEQLALTGESLTAASIREAIESSLRRHVPGAMRSIGVVAPKQPNIPPEIRAQYQMPIPPPEFEDVKRFLGEQYEVLDVELDDPAGVPADVDVLLVLKPKALSETAVFQLDQYLMRGGRVVLCAGNYETEFSANGLQVNPLETGLDDWLAHYGVSLGRSLVLDDRNQPLPIPEIRNTPLGTMRTWTLAPYPYLVQVRDDGFLNRDITASLESVGIYWGSEVVVDEAAMEGKNLESIPILQSSDRSWTSDDLTEVGFVDYSVPSEGTQPRLLATALNGRFESYFVGKPIPGSEPSGLPDSEDPLPESIPSSVILEQSPETRLVVIGNSEFLSDFVARAIGRLDGGFFVENMRFVENVIDWAGLDNDMIDIRSRGVASRRLVRLDNSAEILSESANYLIPLLVLAAVGGFLYWKRTHAVPLSDPSLPRPTETTRTTGEA